MAGWQYLQQPEAIAAELWRITRPKGQVIVAFSNRMFFTKAPQIWTDGDDRDHLRYVSSVLMAQGGRDRGRPPGWRGDGTVRRQGRSVLPWWRPNPWAEQSALLNRAGASETAHPLLWLRRRSPDPIPHRGDAEVAPPRGRDQPRPAKGADSAPHPPGRLSLGQGPSGGDVTLSIIPARLSASAETTDSAAAWGCLELVDQHGSFISLRSISAAVCHGNRP